MPTWELIGHHLQRRLKQLYDYILHTFSVEPLDDFGVSHSTYNYLDQAN